MFDPREAFQTSSPHRGCMVWPAALVIDSPIMLGVHPMQSLSAIVDTGEAASPRYVRQRELIEARHSGNDDGTETHYARQHGARREYTDIPDPISDESPTHCLAYYGLGVRMLELLERHDCLTIGDVRVAVSNCEILAWHGGGAPTEREIRESLEAIPK